MIHLNVSNRNIKKSNPPSPTIELIIKKKKKGKTLIFFNSLGQKE